MTFDQALLEALAHVRQVQARLAAAASTEELEAVRDDPVIHAPGGTPELPPHLLDEIRRCAARLHAGRPRRQT